MVCSMEGLVYVMRLCLLLCGLCRKRSVLIWLNFGRVFKFMIEIFFWGNYGGIFIYVLYREGNYLFRVVVNCYEVLVEFVVED